MRKDRRIFFLGTHLPPISKKLKPILHCHKKWGERKYLRVSTHIHGILIQEKTDRVHGESMHAKRNALPASGDHYVW
jgi:hypothetical protein